MSRVTLCKNCVRRTCLKSGVPCREVEALLPSPGGGRRESEWIGIANVGRLVDGPSRAALREASEGRRLLMRLADRHRNLLSSRERLAALLVWGMGCSLNEAAGRLGVNKGSVQCYMERTLAKLFDVLVEVRVVERKSRSDGLRVKSMADTWGKGSRHALTSRTGSISRHSDEDRRLSSKNQARCLQ